MCSPFPTQAKATQASLQCGTEGLSPGTLIPKPFIKKISNKMLLQKETIYLNYRCNRHHIIKGADVPWWPTKQCSKSGNSRDMRGTWRMGGGPAA